MALIGVLSQHKRVSTESVLEKLLEATKVSKKMKGQEQRDGMFGRLFGYLAIVRAGRVDSAKVRWTVGRAMRNQC